MFRVLRERWAQYLRYTVLKIKESSLAHTRHHMKIAQPRACDNLEHESSWEGFF